MRSELMKRVIAEPDSDEPRWVFADWLESTGELWRAELIRRQIDVARLDPTTAEWRRARDEAEILELQHGPAIRAELPAFDGLTWGELDRGFVGTVCVMGLDALFEHGERLAELAPVHTAEIRAVAPGQPDLLTRPVPPWLRRLRIIGSGSQALALRVVLDAERAHPDTVYAALNVERGQENWEARVAVLREDLPRLVSGAEDPARRVMHLLRRFAESTTHGADLWWCQRLLGQIAAGVCGELVVPDDVRQAAAALAERFWLGHRTEERDALRAELERWWRPIPAGRFRMGSPEGDRFHREGPQHEVEVVHGFDALAVPVRQDWYERFDPEHRADRFGDGDAHPVVNVTWYEGMAFAAWLGAGARLPTETEWEHMCRAGTTTRFWSGDAEEDLARVGWYDQNSGRKTHPVGELPANPWGLHDVHGNVLEWCADPLVEYTGAPRRHDPRRPDLRLKDTGAGRATRGGNFDFSARWARSAFRDDWLPSFRDLWRGFRLVRVVAPPAGGGRR